MGNAVRQLELLEGSPSSALPEGFKYRADLVSAEEERALILRFADLPFREFEYQNFQGKRRVVSFGWRYDFKVRRLQKTDDIPDFLLSLRAVAAAFANLPPEDLQQVLVTEYPLGAPIGWHKDRPEFGEVVGVSLLAPCILRFRRKMGSKWERASLIAEPRSAYLLSGAARQDWQHSIPPVESLRYSVTFRSFKAR
jgi:alkylated DNA repair dioxygenase AlkB